MDLIFIAFYDDNDLQYIFCEGTLYFSNKKNKITIYYCSRFSLRMINFGDAKRQTGTGTHCWHLRFFFCI